jgi:hypothetical protein
LKECAEDCADAIKTSDLVGAEFTCRGEDEGRCRCLFLGGETRAAEILDPDDFDDVDTDGDATIPPGNPPEKMRLSKFGFMLRKKKHDKDKILCGKIYAHEDDDDYDKIYANENEDEDDDDNTFEMWFPKVA